MSGSNGVYKSIRAIIHEWAGGVWLLPWLVKIITNAIKHLCMTIAAALYLHPPGWLACGSYLVWSLSDGICDEIAWVMLTLGDCELVMVDCEDIHRGDKTSDRPANDVRLQLSFLPHFLESLLLEL